MEVEANKRQGLKNKTTAKQTNKQYLLGPTLKLELFPFGIHILLCFMTLSASSLYTTSSIRSILLSK